MTATVISAVNPKGGVGKSTLVLLLSTFFATQEVNGRPVRVSVIDVDPNTPIYNWRKDGKSNNPIKVISHATNDEGEKVPIKASNILNIIQEEAVKSDFVFIDLEGTANQIIAYAISVSQLVLIPMQPSVLDSKQAGQAIGLIKECETLAQMQGAANYKIDYKVVLSRAPASDRIITRQFKELLAYFRESNIPHFDTWLADREPYRLIFAEGLSLYELDGKSGNMRTALENIGRLAGEVIDHLNSVRQSRRKGEAA